MINLLFLEVLGNPEVVARMADTKAAAEVKALENFYAILQTEPGRAFYGFRHVSAANEAQAIDTLLLSDNLFRSKSVEERKRYVALVESVREYGGTTRIFSSLHVSGERELARTENYPSLAWKVVLGSSKDISSIL